MHVFRFFNEFPEDIQRLIFEYAFEELEAVQPNTVAIELALVSMQATRWIRPLIYRNISTSRVRGNPMRGPSRHKEFFRDYAKSLSVDEMFESDFLEAILTECHKNLVGLAWWPIAHNRKKWASFLLTREFPSLRKLSVYYGIFPSDIDAPFGQPIFQNLTHLDIGLPTTDAEFGASISSTNTLKVTSWKKHLRSLEFLLHFHLDLKRTLTFRAPAATEIFQEVVLDILSHLPHTAKYFSINLPFNFLAQAARLPPNSRRVYDDIIQGKIDPRTLVCYQPSNRLSLFIPSETGRKMVQSFITEPGFSEYLLPRNRIHDAKMSRIATPQPNNDFWGEAETAIRKRNKKLSD